MSVDTDVGFWKWLAGTLVSMVAALFGYHKYMEAKLDKKADKHTVNNQLQKLEGEQTLQRGHIAKLFDQMREDRTAAEQQMRENEQRAQDRHERLMERISK